MKKLSINDIAKSSGVSKTTVSFVINGKGDEKSISKKTQQRIFDCIDELGYQPNFMAQNLKRGKTQTIVYLVPDIANPFFAKIGRYIEDFLLERGYYLIISSTNEDPEKEARMLTTFYNRQVDGFILALSEINTTQIANYIEHRVPLVFFDREDELVQANYVVVENRMSMKAAVDQLIKKGKKKIGLCSLTPDVKPLKLRIEGYKDSLKNNKIAFNQDLLCEVNPKDIKDNMHKHIQYLMNEKVDGIVFTNNQVATEGLWQLNKYFKETSATLGLATFDNVEWFDYSSFQIISLAQPTIEIAKNIVEILFNAIENKNANQRSIVLKPKLIIR